MMLKLLATFGLFLCFMTPVFAVDDHGNTLETATDTQWTQRLNSDEPPVPYVNFRISGEFESTSDVDYFLAEIPYDGTLVITKTEGVDLHASLRNSTGGILSSGEIGTYSTVSYPVLENGTNYLSVQPTLTAGSYTIEFHILREPSELQASDGSSSDHVLIYWYKPVGPRLIYDEFSDASAYTLYRCSTTSTGSCSDIYTGAGVQDSPFGSYYFYDTVGATPGVTYYYRIKSRKGTAITSYSDYETGYRALLPPSAPNTPSASDGLYSNKITVSWTGVIYATSYELYRCSDATTGSCGSAIYTGSNTSYDDTGVSYNTDYYYRVKAVNSAGTSGYSSTDLGYLLSPPATPSAPTASDGTYSDRVVISWSAVSGAIDYILVRCLGPELFSCDPIYFGSRLSYEDLSADLNVIYYYFLVASNDGDDSDISARDTGYRGNLTDDHGNNIGAATLISSTSSTIGSLEYGNDWDLFKIELPSDGELSVNTTGSTDTYGYLLDSNGDVLAENDDTGGANFLISGSLSAGIYYIRVRGYDHATTGDYILEALFSGGAVRDDFGGDGNADILIRDIAGGQLFLYEMDGSTRTGSNIGGLSTAWTVQGIADFGEDGNADILVRKTSNGQLYLYEMDGSSKTGSSIGIVSTGLDVAGVGDLGGDDNADIVLRDSSTGSLELYEMDGNTVSTSSIIGSLALTWDVEGIADFGGDGNDDILIRHTGTGQLYLYEMDGSTRTGSNIGGLSLSWEVAGVGDVGGDGNADIIIRNIGTGQLYLYEMDGNSRTGSNIGGLPLAWEVARIADYGGDGKADILIRNTSSGQLYLYEMDGNSRTGSNIGGLSTTWQVEVQ